MLTVYDAQGRGLAKRQTADSCESTVWIDLLDPTGDEEKIVETMLGVEMPTREEMHEIEVSSRLYQEHGAHYMTAVVMHQTDSPVPQSTAITFILTESHLVTLRFAQPRAFPLFLSRAGKGDTMCDTAMAVMLGLIEAIVDRGADLIERLQADTEKLAQSVFSMKGGATTRGRRYDAVLKQIGKAGEVAARARESLLSLERVLTYLAQVANVRKEHEALRRRIKTETRDVLSLSDHLSYLHARISFMLEATLGMVSIEQNQIIKLFSVVAVMLMPPTLIASIYGMNFRHMPELEFTYGYPMALAMMVLGALLPFLYFKRKGWL